MVNMKRILVITWFYPPVNSSEGIVTYKLLNNSKYNYDVFTQKKSIAWSYGNNEKLKNNKNINCVFANADDLNSWKKEAVEYFKDKKDKYDIVMTRSMPPESHEIGIKIKKIKPNIKWIASFGDPIANNPYVFLRKKNNIKSYAKSTLLELKNKILEKNIIDNADYIIFNSKYQKEFMLNGKNKNNLILPHSYDDRLFNYNVKKNNKIVISYFGHLDDIRNAGVFLQSLNELCNEDIYLKNKIIIKFYGDLGQSDIDFIKSNKLETIVKYGFKVNYLDSLKKMCESDYLLLIDANISSVINRNIFFAAKLADYIGSGTPIIGITMLDGISADILRNTNNLVLTYSKSDIKNYLRKIIYENYTYKTNKDEMKKYDVKIVAKQFDAFIKGVFDYDIKK